jgi:regulation of enolase protein 1 (concanavalin A-like superfamily)
MGRPSGSIGVVNEGVEFWSKDTPGAFHTTIAAQDQPLPNWLKLTRAGDVFTSYVSSDGASWLPVGTVTVPMGTNVYIGAEVQTAQYAVWATASFDHVSVGSFGPPPPPPPGPLPSPWQNRDVGNVSVPGSASYASGQFTVNGSGNDIWDTQDGFQFVYQTLPSDGEIDAQVMAVQNTDTFAKGGLMLRASLAADSPHVILDLRPTGDIEFMTRSTSGGTTSWLSGAFLPAPSWLKLVRAGSVVTGYSSPDGQAWTAVGSTAIGFASPAYIGMAVVSHTSTINTSTFNNVGVTAAPPPGGDCPSVTLSNTFFYSGAPESNWTIGVTTPVAGCSWSVTPDSSWIVVAGTTPAIPAGDGTFSLRILQNTTGLFRTGHIAVAGTVYDVKQEP